LGSLWVNFSLGPEVAFALSQDGNLD